VRYGRLHLCVASAGALSGAGGMGLLVRGGAQGVEHGLHGGARGRCGSRDGENLPGGLVETIKSPNDDVGVRDPDGECGNQREAQPGGDEPLARASTRRPRRPMSV
jgi:hypothetical protein